MAREIWRDTFMLMTVICPRELDPFEFTSQSQILVLFTPYLMHVLLIFTRVIKDLIDARFMTHVISAILWLAYFKLRLPELETWGFVLLGQVILWCFFKLNLDVELVWLLRRNKITLLFCSLAILSIETVHSQWAPHMKVTLKKPNFYFFIILSFKVMLMLMLYGNKCILNCLYKDMEKVSSKLYA